MIEDLDIMEDRVDAVLRAARDLRDAARKYEAAKAELKAYCKKMGIKSEDLNPR